jgi:aminoglycoside 6'-N-acetyltransferase
MEETGYEVRVVRLLHEKRGCHAQIDFQITYFEVEVVGGEATIQDPDQLIHEIAWKSYGEIEELLFCFEEDRQVLLDYMKGK